MDFLDRRHLDGVPAERVPLVVGDAPCHEEQDVASGDGGCGCQDKADD